MDADVKEFFLIGYEDPISRVLAHKLELAKRFGKYMSKFRTSPEVSKAIFDRVKEKSRTEGHCTTHLSEMHFELKKPAKYCHYKNMYEVVKELDEAESVPPIESCKFMSYMDLVFTAKLAEILVRGYDLPVVSINEMNARYLMIMSCFFSPVRIGSFRRLTKILTFRRTS